MHGKPYKFTVILQQSVAAVAVAEPVVVGLWWGNYMHRGMTLIIPIIGIANRRLFVQFCHLPICMFVKMLYIELHTL